jgi:hypothetical protein
MFSRAETRIPTALRTEGQHLGPLRHLLRTKHQSDDGRLVEPGLIIISIIIIIIETMYYYYY